MELVAGSCAERRHGILALFILKRLWSSLHVASDRTSPVTPPKVSGKPRRSATALRISASPKPCADGRSKSRRLSWSWRSSRFSEGWLAPRICRDDWLVFVLRCEPEAGLMADTEEPSGNSSKACATAAAMRGFGRCLPKKWPIRADNFVAMNGAFLDDHGADRQAEDPFRRPSSSRSFKRSQAGESDKPRGAIPRARIHLFAGDRPQAGR